MATLFTSLSKEGGFQKCALYRGLLQIPQLYRKEKNEKTERNIAHRPERKADLIINHCKCSNMTLFN